MNRCDRLLAGLPRDPDCSVRLPSSPSVIANGKCDKYWGSSSDKPLDYTICWSRTLEPETLGPAASKDSARSVDCRLRWSTEPLPQGARPCSNPGLPKDLCNNQELVKRQSNVDKNPVEASCSKAKGKSTMMIPDCQKLLRSELESLKSQLQAQTKAFEFLNHSVTMLEKESCLQQIKIQQLEEVLSPTGRKGEKEGPRAGAEQGQQELYGALVQGIQGLQKTLRDSEEVQRTRTTRCLQLLAQDIKDSKKFLWEELQLVREEVNVIYRKLQLQENEISENLMNIQKLQKTQVKCRKILTKMKQQGCDTSACLETEEMLPGGSGCWNDELQKELSDIWSSVNVLQDSIDSLTMASGARPRALNLRGRKGRRCPSPPLHSWDSDSDSDQDISQPPFSKSRSFPPA
nr:coiled-coil domain-containing protein 159 isoform X2 [Microcebus murinus]